MNYSLSYSKSIAFLIHFLCRELSSYFLFGAEGSNYPEAWIPSLEGHTPMC
jgi:hypothetical protein